MSISYVTLDLVGATNKTGFNAIKDVSVFKDGCVELSFDDNCGGYYTDLFSSKEEAIAYLDKIKAFIEAN